MAQIALLDVDQAGGSSACFEREFHFRYGLFRNIEPYLHSSILISSLKNFVKPILVFISILAGFLCEVDKNIPLKIKHSFNKASFKKMSCRLNEIIVFFFLH